MKLTFLKFMIFVCFCTFAKILKQCFLIFISSTFDFFIELNINYFFEVLGSNNIAEINGLSISIVFIQDLAKKFAQFSVSACEFCKDVQKLACFGTFGCKRSLPNYENVENKKN